MIFADLSSQIVKKQFIWVEVECNGFIEGRQNLQLNLRKFYENPLRIY